MKRSYHVTAGVVIALFLSAGAAHATELQDVTVEAWDAYVLKAEASVNTRLSSDKTFLWIDEEPERGARVRRGEILVGPVGPNPHRVQKGLIHDWVGAAFVPHATIDDVLAVVRNYDRYKDFYAPLVIDSKTLDSNGADYTFNMLMVNQSLFSRNALDGRYVESWNRVSEHRCYSIARSTLIQEVDDFGRPAEHRLPPDQGSGYIWRVHSIQKFEQRDGGVYIELEVIALSRDIPVSLRWIVDPIVRRVSRDSLLTSLDKTRTAVRSQPEAIHAANSGANRPAAAMSWR